MKIKIGIIFGGSSKEREISFAGGRTVYDNLNKSLFEPVPVFVDSFNNFILLDWQFIYKGSIRDFYPPVEALTEVSNDYQVYAESLGNLSLQQQEELISKIGRKVSGKELINLIDFAFLCLHGPYGEDGKIQGLLEYYSIPYSGSGILPSAIGIDKAVQKELMIGAGFNSPEYFTLTKLEWLNCDQEEVFKNAKKNIKLPLVVKSSTQGSSIGVNILAEDNFKKFCEYVDRSFFISRINVKDFLSKTDSQRKELIRILTDIREGIGIPVLVAETVIYHPSELEKYILSSGKETLLIQSLDSEEQIIVEGFIEGKEFSCIVIQKENNSSVALPPTEIRKGKELFDYRSKYLPGLSRKITPIDLPESDIYKIRKECEALFSALNFDVYARIDGFMTKRGKVFLNDPNTTSGMMPSSFFFHQAAEIGLNPSQFLTYIIKTSLAQRIRQAKNPVKWRTLASQLESSILKNREEKKTKIKVAVLLGGFSSERHISVESGRNIYEKLASSAKYDPIPVFLTGNEKEHLLYQIPINILLKDNADDIKEKIEKYNVHPVVQEIIKECSEVTATYSSAENLATPQKLTYKDLAKRVESVFIALHGRPGEDGAVQRELEKVGLPYNGSGVESSKVTINKFETNEILAKNGFSVAKHFVVTENDWLSKKGEILEFIETEIKLPLIAKPVDDGCSSAVRKIKTYEELDAFASLIFRKEEELNPKAAALLKIKPKEEFPRKKEFLIEELIEKKNAIHFLEITGGLLTKLNEKGEVEYEVFEASEALSEGEVLSLEEKFLAGQGQNITPARYSRDKKLSSSISNKVKEELKRAAKILTVEGYARIDAFVRVYENNEVEVIFIEVNSLPGMTPATCIFHQTAINGYKPYDFIDAILEFGFKRKEKLNPVN